MWMIVNIASDDALILPHHANPAGLNFRERHVEFGFAACVQDMNLLAEGARCLLDILELGCCRRIVRIEKHSDQRGTRD